MWPIIPHNIHFTYSIQLSSILSLTLLHRQSPKPEWRVAIESEFKVLLGNDTWSPCPRPSSHHIVRNKWVYKIKQKPDDSTDHYKVRLVVKGFDQRFGVDYFETFSPIVKPTTIPIILALAVQFWSTTWQLDVSNAFLQGYLDDEEVYTEQPKGFIIDEHPTFVCQLHRSLYSFKQAPRA
jgi:hypothetical protein